MRISVVIPSYEAGPFLLEALDSLESQTGLCAGADFEAVVVNDGAYSAESKKTIEQAGKMPWVKVVSTKGKVGPSGARNLGVKHARGEWLSFLDADDIYAPDSLQRRLDLAESYTAATCVVTDYAEFNALGPFEPDSLKGVIATTAFRRRPVQSAHDTQTDIVLDRPLLPFIGTLPIWTGSIFVKRAVFDALGGFPEGHYIGEDLHLWLRIAATQRIVYTPEITAYCRKGHDSLTTRETRMNLRTARCYEDLVRDPVIAPGRSRIRGLIASSYHGESYTARKQGQHLRALVMALHLVRWRPFALVSWKAVAFAFFPARSRS